MVLSPVMGIFGSGIVFVPAGLTPIPLPDAVLDEEASVTVPGDDGMAITVQKPVVGIRVAALGGYVPQQGDRVIDQASGRTYIVSNPLSDGHGHVLCHLMWTGA
ncbi:MAG TPA: hypothetical protein VFF98_14920 [Novosphingobium sp.]|nr:hypothetical protein [Novosphingobium sp.]HZV10548.1 hypothetical protein [Novosphingobium sp.]